jgi:hypothetical protein
MNKQSPAAKHVLSEVPGNAVDRRTMLRLFVSGAAVALASCGPPPEEIVPYVEMPDREVPGLPLQFATALALAGYGRGVIVTSIEGRPIKICTILIARARPIAPAAFSPGPLSKRRCGGKSIKKTTAKAPDFRCSPAASLRRA